MKRLTLPFLFVCAAATLPANSRFAFWDLGSGSLELRENGQPVFVYNYGMKLKEGVPESRRRSSYLHPVYAPGGTVLTDDFPADHYHHRGISWMWPVVKMEGRQYSLWDIEGIRQRFVRWTARDAGSGSAALGIENGWFVGDRKVLREIVEIVTHAVEGNRRTLDFTLSFEALDAPIEISGAPAQQKGYGGFCFRFAPREQTVVSTDSGKEVKDTNLVPHPWAELAGNFQGRHAGAHIEINPSHPAFPNGWCLRNYGFLGVSFPGLTPYTLARGRPVLLKYRVILFSE